MTDLFIKSLLTPFSKGRNRNLLFGKEGIGEIFHKERRIIVHEFT